MTQGGAWRELRPPPGRRIDGLIETTPVPHNGSTIRKSADGFHLTSSGIAWDYIAGLRLNAGVVEPSRWTAPITLRITASALQGRTGAVFVADDLRTVLSNSVEWTEADGPITLTVVLYSYPGQGWLIFRNTPGATPDSTPGTYSKVQFCLTAVEAFAVDHALPAWDPGGREGLGRAVIFTTITNRYDTLKPPPRPEPDCDYVCFTDDPELVPPPWRPVRIEHRLGNPRLDATWYRLHPHVLFPDHDVSIYFDGRFELQQDILPLARGVLADTSLAVFDNPWHDCVYLGADDDLRHGRDTPDVIRAQLDRYRRAGLPRHLACLPTGILMRRHHDPAIVQMATAWWEEIENASHRNQMSFSYVIWSLGLPFRRVRLPVDDNPYAKLGEHNFVDFYLNDAGQGKRGIERE